MRICTRPCHAYLILPVFMLILHWKPPLPLRHFHAHLALDNSPAPHADCGDSYLAILNSDSILMLRMLASVLLCCTISPAAQSVRAKHSMVVSGEANATAIGVAALNSGGNAMD